jgi:hypothetical protein
MLEMDIPYTLLHPPPSLVTGQVSGGFFCCIFSPYSCNLKAAQDFLKKYKKKPRKTISQAVMGTENRLHSRARVRWPVVIQTPTGLVDGKTENLSLGGGFIRLSNELNSSHNLPVVLNAKGRFISCTAQIVWSDERNLSDQRKFLGIGVRFTRIMLHDREFLHGEISNHT